MGRVLHLLPDPLPAIAAPRGRLPRKHVAHVQLSRGRRARRRNGPLFAFSIPLWAARVDHIPAQRDALLVQVTGEQFAWNVHYAGADGVFGRTDIKLLDLQSNPLGSIAPIPGRERRRHDAQSSSTCP
jgi:hypothetical protein